jgi:hypothetical protein
MPAVDVSQSAALAGLADAKRDNDSAPRGNIRNSNGSSSSSSVASRTRGRVRAQNRSSAPDDPVTRTIVRLLASDLESAFK